jgi:TrmH family RNA methyltransferase
MKRIDSTQNEAVKKMRALKAKKGRDEYGQFLAEGEKCVEEALLSHIVVESVFTYGENRRIEALAHERGVEVITVSRPVIEAITSVQTPQNVAACVAIPPQVKPMGDLVVALECVSDPQNVGSIIRSADAAGAAGVVFGAGCADWLNPKAVRASMGSIFHLHLYEGDLAAYLCEFKKSGCVIAGHLNGKSEFPACMHMCLVIGNESKGVGEETANLCDSLYKIPIYGRAESLNASVAAGIMMYMAREKMEKAKEEFRK